MVSVISIFNFIRRTVYPSGRLVQDDIDTVLYEVESLKQNGLKATYALKYDALMEKTYVDIIKNNTDDTDEIACWWEVDRSLANKAGVKWKAKTPVDDTVNIGYSLAYTKEERIRLIDVYMDDFKMIFGYYPKTVGSWVIDSISLKYFREKYDVRACVICRDQIGTDGFTLNGGYYNGGYYPSKYNEFMPAQSPEKMIDMPIFRMLGPDPIYAFEDGVRKSVMGVYTLEPAATIAQDEKWVSWMFDRLTKEKDIGFSFSQLGQENTFLWNTMSRGFDVQMPKVKNLLENKEISLMNIHELSEWFRDKYKLTPVTSFSATNDWCTDDLKTFWYNSRFYRTSFLVENNEVYIRDLNIFDEIYYSRYYDDILIEKESIFDALPFVKPHEWSIESKRNKIEFINSKTKKVLKWNVINFDSDEESKYMLELKSKDKFINIVCFENEIKFNGNFDFEISINKLPVFKEFKDRKILCNYNNHDYYIELKAGRFLKSVSEYKIKSSNLKIELDFSMGKYKKELEFLNTKVNKKENMYNDKVIMTSKKHIMKKAFKPSISPISKVIDIDEKIKFNIKNLNKEGSIYYTVDGSIPNENSILYQGEFEILGEVVVKAVALSNGYKNSDIEEVNIYESFKLNRIRGDTNPVDRELYNKCGTKGFINRELGSIHYNDGNWIGYYDDLRLIAELEEKMSVSKISIRFLQDTRAWIYYPKSIIFEASDDGINFKLIEKLDLTTFFKLCEIGVESAYINCNIFCKYIRVSAENRKIGEEDSLMPSEGPLFIFSDQLMIK